MGRPRFLALLAIVLSVSACAALLDFDELQKGGAGGAATAVGGAAGSSAGAGGSAGSSAGGGSGGASGAVGAAGAGGAPGVPLDEAASVVADALCSKLEDCFGNAALEVVLFDEDCRTVETSALENTIVANVTQSEQNGTLDYDPTALPACIDAVAALDCEALTVSFPEDCKQALGGLQQEGNACEHSLECEAGLYCKTDPDTCPGICSQPLAADAPCTDLDVCAPGLTCFQSACTALGKQGEACGGDVLPGCLTGLLCFGDDKAKMQTGKCFPAKDVFSASEGQSCSFFSAIPTMCREGSSCPLISFTPMCLARVASGGECQLAIPDMCPEGEYCNAGTCAPLPGAGEPCAGGIVLKPPCSAYMRCVSGTCRLLGDNGNTCAVDGECYSGVCDTGRCAAPLCQ